MSTKIAAEGLDDLRMQLSNLVNESVGRLPIVEAVCSGQLPRQQLQVMAARMYAETRTALQIKLPERLRICPIEASALRRYWCHQLDEESGNFEPGQDHASLLMPVCLALGLTREQLEAEFQRYHPIADYLRESPVSLELSLREATQVFVEESVLAGQAMRIADALRDRYGLSEPALAYFRVHAQLDVAHSAAGLEVLVRCATTPQQRQLVLESAQAVLAGFPTWVQDISPLKNGVMI
ncbi:MAG: iron-containing redox enzyme family protein [Pirellulales bacterium]